MNDMRKLMETLGKIEEGYETKRKTPNQIAKSILNQYKFNNTMAFSDAVSGGRRYKLIGIRKKDAAPSYYSNGAYTIGPVPTAAEQKKIGAKIKAAIEAAGWDVESFSFIEKEIITRVRTPVTEGMETIEQLNEVSDFDSEALDELVRRFAEMCASFGISVNSTKARDLMNVVLARAEDVEPIKRLV